jgi:DmsE family decaheme c-type cytochrome
MTLAREDRTMRSRSLVFCGVLLAASVSLLVTAQPPASQEAPEYIGSEACKTCHEAQWEGFQTNPHHRAELDSSVVADRVGCESCHGPGSQHAAADGDRTEPGFASIRNFKTMKAADASATCRSCHKGGEQFYWQHSNHARADVSCIQCHSIHHPKSAKNAGTGPMLTSKDVNELCGTCHKDKRHALTRSAHMPLREGGMTCASCHNPHGAATEKMLRASTPNELCLGCHADKRGPFLWEHAPVRENCLNCHQPHGSNNPKVLASKVPYLCQRCHVATRHPSTLYDLNDLASNRLVNRSCTNCHSQIHGSNHPSGTFFTR